MAFPATPTSFYVQQGNRQVYLSWDMSVGSTSYSVLRSPDGVTYSPLATPAVNNYLDTTATVGTLYYYKVAAVNGSGTSPYTNAQSIIATPAGEMSLGQIRLAAQQRADKVNSNFVTVPEWNSYINQGLFELYDLVVTSYQDYFIAAPVVITVNPSAYSYPLPDGLNYSAALPFYKLVGVDLAINTASNAYVPLDKFNFIDRNDYPYASAGAASYNGFFNPRYRVMGGNLQLDRPCTSGQSLRLWYVPRLVQLLQDTDITTSSISGWIEYVIVDAAIKALQKEESDITMLMAQKMALMKRIQDSTENRDQGRPDTISDTSSNFGSNGYDRAFGWGGW